jgi:hypothetical protein
VIDYQQYFKLLVLGKSSKINKKNFLILSLVANFNIIFKMKKFKAILLDLNGALNDRKIIIDL